MTDDQERAAAEERPAIKDRRRFTPEGDRRTDAETEASAGDTAGRTSPPRGASIDFFAFVQSLYLSALMAMGEAENPETKQVSTNLEIARQNIDILTMLRDKTRGNLTEQESALIEEVVPQLQLLYVEKAD